MKSIVKKVVNSESIEQKQPIYTGCSMKKPDNLQEIIPWVKTRTKFPIEVRCPKVVR